MDAAATIDLRSGNAMPVIGLGTWQLDQDPVQTLNHAIKLGYRMIDTSGDYGTQPAVGGAVRSCGVSRDDLFIVTKVEETDNAFEAAQDYLGEMDIEYLDLVLIHRPPHHGAGVDLWKGLIKAREEGIAIDIGVSNYTIDQIDELFKATGEMPVVNQIEWSPFGFSVAMRNYCNDNDIVIQAYSPLTRTQELAEPELVAIAKHHNKTPAQILIRWNIQNETVPLPKANSWDHLAENIDVFDFQLSVAEMVKLDSMNRQYSALGRRLAYV